MTTTGAFKMSDHLGSNEMIAEYLDACLEEGGTELFLAGIGHVMKARGMKGVAERAGLASRTSAYRSFSQGGNPEVSSLSAVLDALDLRLSVVPKHHAQAS